MAAEKTDKRPFIVLMQHTATSDPVIEVAPDWDKALTIAGKYWVDTDGIFDPKADKPFSVDPELYDPNDLDVEIKMGESLRLCFAKGEGNVITIDRSVTRRLVWP